MISHDPKTSARHGVVVCGAYGMQNAGDDAVLTAILAELRRQEPDMPITVLARRPRAVARRFGVSAVHPLDFPRWLAAMGRAKLFLSGGGSLLQDVTSRRSLFYYLLTIRAAKKRGCAVQLYGCGVGPLERARSRQQTARTLNECADVITLRDGGSAGLLDSIGVTEPPILVAADPALSLPSPAGEREKSAGFVLRDWPGFPDHMPAIAACARYAWEAYKLAPVFICLAPGDREPARVLCRALEELGVPGSVTVDARRTGRMTLLLSMRLHGLIFALREGTPAAGISYDPKVSSFCGEAGLPVLPLADVTAEGLCRLLDEAAHLDGEALAQAAAQLRQREKINGRAAARLLSGDA